MGLESFHFSIFWISRVVIFMSGMSLMNSPVVSVTGKQS